MHSMLIFVQVDELVSSSQLNVDREEKVFQVNLFKYS
jgi:hypothetical protein